MTSKVKVTGCRYLEWTCGWIAGACAINIPYLSPNMRLGFLKTQELLLASFPFSAERHAAEKNSGSITHAWSWMRLVSGFFPIPLSCKLNTVHKLEMVLSLLTTDK